MRNECGLGRGEEKKGFLLLLFSLYYTPFFLLPLPTSLLPCVSPILPNHSFSPSPSSPLSESSSSSSSRLRHASQCLFLPLSTLALWRRRVTGKKKREEKEASAEGVWAEGRKQTGNSLGLTRDEGRGRRLWRRGSHVESVYAYGRTWCIVLCTQGAMVALRAGSP